MPLGGSVTTDVGTSPLHLAGVVVLSAIGLVLIALLVRWAISRLEVDRAGERPGDLPAGRRPEHPATSVSLSQPAPPAPVRRPAAAGHHPVGRRATGSLPAQPAPARRPLELVAADLRRLTRELAMVPGGTPVARRRGLLAAFDDVLVEAAVLLEVPNQLSALPPATRDLERMRLLATLEAAGLAVAD